MTATQLLNDQRFLFPGTVSADLPGEEIELASNDAVLCLNLGALDDNDWRIGGLIEEPTARVGIRRSIWDALDTAPRPGNQATFRNQTWLIKTIRKDHPQSPVMVELEKAGRFAEASSGGSGGGEGVMDEGGGSVLDEGGGVVLPG